MIVAVLQVELGIEGAASLKDKRRVVRGLKDRLHREHQVSVAEVATLEQWAVATLGIVMAGSDLAHCQSTMDRILDKLATGRGVPGGGGFTLNDHHLNFLTGQ